MRAKVTLSAIFILAVIVTLAWQIDTAKGQVVKDGLVGYWSFDKASITDKTVKDVWDDRDGVMMGDTKMVEGKFGDALEFDGAGDYVELDHSNLPAGNTPRTLSAWVKFGGGTSFRSVVEWGAGGMGPILPSERCGILINPEHHVYFVGQWADVPSNAALEFDVWNHATVTYDGDTIRIYINGELDITQAVVLNTVVELMRIGANIRIIGPQDPLGEAFLGIIDEVSIYNRALNSDEVAQNFEAEGLELAVVNSADKLAFTWGAIKAK